MDPVIVGAVVTVAVSVANGIVKIAQQRLTAKVEIARITEAGQTDRIRCTTAPDSRPIPPVPADENGGERHGGRTQY
ncbi:hypothetical protein ABT373_26865 [Streptomyces sp. NPDC000070]|uniref:hypothetical protein n=1 Tax=Streptomyces sp. NPDC000070 TaxID=3154240 RepID=UPI00331F1F0B